VLILKKPWTRQPQAVMGAKDGTTLLYNSATKIDELGGSSFTNTGGFLTVPSLIGLAANLDAGTKYLSVTRRAQPYTLGNWSFVYAFSQYGSREVGAGLIVIPGTSGNNNRLSIYTLGTDRIRADVFNSAGSATTVDSAAVIVSGPFLAELMMVGGSLQWYINGSPSGSAVAFSGSRDGENSAFTVHGYSGGPSPNRVVSGFAFRKNPARPVTSLWELSRPRRIFVPVSVGGGGALPTLSAATYVPNSLTSTGFRPRVTATY
jgi:hypothetical protein